MPVIAPEWRSFEKNVARWVQQHERPGLRFCAGFQAIPGFPSNGFRADALLTDGRRLLAVEVELKQNHPDTNVGKYWMLSKYHAYESVVLLHVYTPAYNSYPWRMELGGFYAEKMAREIPFEYQLLDRRKASNPAPVLSEVQELLSGRIMTLFPLVT